MNQAQDNQSASGSVMTLAQHVANELGKSGTKVWAGLPSPEEMEQLRAEKAERDFQHSKHRAAAYDRRLEEMRQALKRRLQGENSDE
jgi:hypothetical protein